MEVRDQPYAPAASLRTKNPVTRWTGGWVSRNAESIWGFWRRGCIFARSPDRPACKKVKWSRYRSGVAQRVGRGIALLFHDRGTRRGWVVSSTSRLHFTPGKTRYPFYRRLGGPQGRSGRAENLVPTGIRSRTVQTVVSRCTDWATRPTPSSV